MRRFALVLLALIVTVRAASTGLPSDEIATARSILDRIHDVVRANYYPREKIDARFDAACSSADQAIAQAGDLNSAYASIADAVMSVDPRIRFYPPLRSARADYGWRWRLIGDAAYVAQLDHVGDAAVKGLKLGDKILSVEGLAIDRSSYEQLYYFFNTLAPRPGLHVMAQSPGAEPRLLEIATTVRPQRRYRTVGPPSHAQIEWVFTETEKRHHEELKNVASHLRRIDDVTVWKMWDLDRRIPDIAEGLKLASDTRVLILDLRGMFPLRHETALRLLDGIFDSSFEAGTRQHNGSNLALRVHGGAGAFHGLVLVLIDSRTGGYAEFVARVIQQRQRGVLIGDRTLGRVFEENIFPYLRGAVFGFAIGAIALPTGEISLADGSSIDGRGVAPDLLLLPGPADIASRRDIVLAKALAMAKQTTTPEEAFKLFWIDRDDDEDADD